MGDAAMIDAGEFSVGTAQRRLLIRSVHSRRRNGVLSSSPVGSSSSSSVSVEAAVQLLKSLGATVTAVCDTGHVELVRGLGADRVLDYTAGDFTRDEQKYDAVFDSVGKSSFGRCKRLLKRDGIYISSELGPLAQNPFLALIAPLHGGKKVMFPIPKHDQVMVRHVRELIESGAFKPVIDRTYPLDQIVEAYRYVETGQKTGNVVISVEPSRQRPQRRDGAVWPPAAWCPGEPGRPTAPTLLPASNAPGLL
jgi:Zinc-binding dehydrogenase